MKFKVNYSKNAQEDLTAIFEWISARGSPVAAERFVMAILDSCPHKPYNLEPWRQSDGLTAKPGE